MKGTKKMTSRHTQPQQDGKKNLLQHTCRPSPKILMQLQKKKIFNTPAEPYLCNQRGEQWQKAAEF
jgi:hypothetical protein